MKALGWGRLLWFGALSGGCGMMSQGEAPKSPTGTDDASPFPAGADKSRCEYAGRKNRVALEFRGAGARHKNIRRVFAVSSRKQDERVLRCREVDTNVDGIKDLFRTYNERGQPLRELADTDYDGKVDTWIRFAGSKVVEANFDRNSDGEPDEFRIYTSGKLARIRRDSSFNGKIDTWEVYDSGRLTRIGVDLDGDGQVDKWQRDAAYERQLLVKEEAAASPSEAAGDSGAKKTAPKESPNAPAQPPAAQSAGSF